MKKPFVKRFRTKSAPYIYDVNSNEVIRVNNLVFDLIEEIGVIDNNAIVDKWLHRYSEEMIRKSIQEIEDAQNKHRLFSSHRPIISSGYTSAEHIKKNLEYNLNQIILEVTLRCNQRCKYCTFSGRYAYSRRHGEEDMPVDIAIKAVEYFIKHSKKKSETVPPVISFYGGEPILNLNIIKKIIKITKEKDMFDRFLFSLTINGTLLTEEVISFFAENNIMIMISLDGPKQIHDRYRVFPSGLGTFDTILNNLK
ncbi:MAG: radical SAM protein, partial [Acidobacteria bacterium]|nr:radical SAM protein [Acidobacteriota bacterium]